MNTSKKSKHRTVLLIEDNTLILDILARTLEDNGFQVIKAKDGKTGLDLCLQHHPDAILLDLIMPEMSGTEMLRRLRKDPWGKTARVLILTNSGYPDQEKEISKYNIEEYLMKSDLKLEKIVEKLEVV